MSGSDLSRGIADDCGVRWDGFQNDGPRADTCAFTDLDIAQNLGACTDENTASDFWMAVARMFSCSTKSNALKQGNIVFNHACLAHDDPGAMIEQDASAQTGGWMDIHSEKLGSAALYVQRQMTAAGKPEPVCNPVALDGVVSFEEQERRDVIRACRITLANGAHVGGGGTDDVRGVREAFIHQFSQSIRGNGMIAQLASQQGGQSSSETGMGFDAGAQQTADQRVIADTGFRRHLLPQRRQVDRTIMSVGCGLTVVGGGNRWCAA